MVSIYRKLGELLVEHGLITNLQLSIALAAQQTSNRRLGEILVERGFVTEDSIAECLAQQYGYPLADLDASRPTPDAIALIDLESALTLRVLPLSATHDEFTCVIADPLSIPTTDKITSLVRRRLNLKVAPEGKLMSAIRRWYGVREDTRHSGAMGGIELTNRFHSILPVQRCGGVSVFSAVDSELDRDVGILAVPSGSEAHESHARLVRSAARGTSSAICRIYDAFTHEGHWITVTEPLRGEVLDRVLRTRGKRSLAQAADLVATIAEGVDLLHQNGEGCGWVCPQNILLKSDGPMLVPLSLPPPDYVLIKSDTAGASSISGDLHSLGMLLWECVVGQPKTSGPETAMQEASMPAAMRETLASCFESNPTMRYGSPIQLASSLRSYNWVSIGKTHSTGSTYFDRDELLTTLAVESGGERPTFWSRLFGRRAA